MFNWGVSAGDASASTSIGVEDILAEVSGFDRKEAGTMVMELELDVHVPVPATCRNKLNVGQLFFNMMVPAAASYLSIS